MSNFSVWISLHVKMMCQRKLDFRVSSGPKKTWLICVTDKLELIMFPTNENQTVLENNRTKFPRSSEYPINTLTYYCLQRHFIANYVNSTGFFFSATIIQEDWNTL